MKSESSNSTAPSVLIEEPTEQTLKRRELIQTLKRDLPLYMKEDEEHWLTSSWCLPGDVEWIQCCIKLLQQAEDDHAHEYGIIVK